MKATTGDFWTTPATAKVVPTNGITKVDGAAVMGKGLAGDAAQLWPDLPVLLGNRLKNTGNRVYVFCVPEHYRYVLHCFWIITLPTKHDWRERSNRSLMWDGLIQLVEAQRLLGLRYILIPRLGCGAGGLDWETDGVRKVMEHFLDDSYTVIHNGTETLPMDAYEKGEC